MANQKLEVLPNFNIDGCKRLDGKRCYIFTDSNTPGGEFGFLVQQCFEERDSIIDYLKMARSATYSLEPKTYVATQGGPHRLVRRKGHSNP
jgi:hypothetical protein